MGPVALSLIPDLVSLQPAPPQEEVWAAGEILRRPGWGVCVCVAWKQSKAWGPAPEAGEDKPLVQGSSSPGCHPKARVL